MPLRFTARGETSQKYLQVERVPLAWKLCKQWRLRQAIVLLIWICASLYIWVHNQTPCDPRTAGSGQFPKESAFKVTEDDADFFPSDRVPDQTDSFFTQGFKTEVLFVNEARPWMPPNPPELKPITGHKSPSQNISALELESEGVTYVTALQKQWIGFPEIAGRDCPTALYSKTNNSFFPQQVRRLRPSEYRAASADCYAFRQRFGFSRHPKVSNEEKYFPIAFIILFYKDLDQVLFLLRAIYRPHNVYCLSVDTKSSIEFLEAVRAVVRCLPNVFVASKLENIVYAGFSRLMADIDCMEDLLQHPVRWKYVINMPGQQFPLRTNLELVRILKLYNGANDIEGLVGDMLVADRYLYKHTYVIDPETGEMKVKKLYQPNDPPPHGLEMVKGSTYGTFARAFIEFALHDKVAQDFLQWCKLIKSPDEYFWGTLQHSKTINVPGGFKGHPHKKPWLTSYSLWVTNPNFKCATIYVHKICILSPEDFPLFIHRGQLFANKFYITHHPAALHCLDELLYNQTLTGRTRDLTFYKNLPFAPKASKDRHRSDKTAAP
ncbi:unnamed protein product [Lymnaea stagnalis]|uniref:Uncharacterized protein n=1 Tax=Lymnaea stagnalis TaxID=6523 RepID=A0AAV2HAJ3_LYMST